MGKENVIKEKSYSFALRIIKAYKFLSSEQREFILSKQMLRSGTAIGALIRESEFAQSPADFIHKLSVALKEANETEYWILLLKDSEYISQESFDSIRFDCVELIKLLTSIINTSKKKTTNY
jgi:four helix bundle protein